MIKIKKTTACMILLFILFSFFSIGLTAEAADLPRVTVTVNSLNFRLGPGTQYHSLETLGRYTGLSVLAAENGWFLVRKTNGATGWVSAQYTSNPRVVGPVSLAGIGEAKVAVNSLNIRTGPGTSYAMIDSLNQGTELKVLTEEGGWLLVRLTYGSTGWVSKSYVSGYAVVQPVNKVAVNVNSLNFRIGPGSQYWSQETLSRGVTLTVLSTEDGWFLSRKDDGTTGWASGQYTTNPSAKGTISLDGGEKVQVTAADGLNIRTGPGVRFTSIDSLPQGTLLEVLMKESGWLLVRLSYGSTGWVSSLYTSSDLPVDPPDDPPVDPPDDPQDMKVVGYYPYWAAYSGFTPSKIDAAKLTHINYAFANIGRDLKIAMGDSNIDPTNFNNLNALKQQHPHLKTLISVGGWTWSGRFSDVALTDASRTVFADSCVNFILRYGFDGIDLDWEYPVSGGLSSNVRRPQDKQNFTLLLKKIREKLDAQSARDGKDYLLTIAGGAHTGFVNNTELGILHRYLDFANIMTYDIHGTWDTYTDFNAPLYTNRDNSPQYKWSVDAGVKAWLNAGFPKDKLVMGVPFYGHRYNGVTNSNNGLYQRYYSGGSSISYAQVAANYLQAAGYRRYYHSESMVPWLFNGSTFISYEDEQSMSLKAKYVKDNGLAGAMIWELSHDPNRVLLNSLYEGLK